MEFIKNTNKYFIIGAFAIFTFIALVFSGCSDSGEYYLTNGADYLFAIKSNYTGSEGKKPLDDLLKLSDAEKNYVTYEIEDTSIISIDNNGIVSTCDCQDQKVTYINADFGDKVIKIKVVVAGDYDPGKYKYYSNLYIPYGETDIGTGYSSSNISYLNVPGTIEDISIGAFYKCEKLNEVIIQSGVNTIPENTFYECNKLKYVSIPSSITTIGESAFRECDTIESLTLYEGLTTIDDFAFYSCGNLKEIDLPTSLTYIGARAFCNCSSIISAIIPDGVKKINNDAFSSCSSLSALKLPNSLENIGERAFLNCRALENLEIPESVSSLGLDAFSGCINIKSLTMPLTLPVDKSVFPSVASIEYFHFTGHGDGFDYSASNYVNTPWYTSRNHKIKVDIDEGITSIGDYTFIYCYGLVEINLPNSLNKICHGAFRKCFNLEKIVIPDNVTSIELHAFSLDYALSDITMSKNIFEIGEYAFYCCTGITEVNLPDSLTVIDNSAFEGCNNIKSVNLGGSNKSNLKRVGVNAFAGLMFDCSGISINSSKIKYIASGAFGYVGDEKPVNTVATLGRDSKIYVANSNIKKYFTQDKNYNSNDTSIIVR